MLCYHLVIAYITSILEKTLKRIRPLEGTAFRQNFVMVSQSILTLKY